jgi:hypothetical protein
MAYVDLNPVRAKIADIPEDSDYTSAQRWIQCLKNAISENSTVQPPQLLAFVGNPREPMPDGLPFKLDDYLELLGRSYASCVRGISESIHVNWSGRIVREGIRGAIAANIPSILQRLGIAVKTWERLNRQFVSKSALCFGNTITASKHKPYFGLKRLRIAG